MQTSWCTCTGCSWNSKLCKVSQEHLVKATATSEYSGNSTSTKRCKRKKTFVELVQEESSLLKERIYLSSLLKERIYLRKINGSLARKAIRELVARGSIRMLSAHQVSRFTLGLQTPRCSTGHSLCSIDGIGLCSTGHLQ